MSSNAMNNKAETQPEPERPTTVLCKLFSDHISEQLCMVRKKELVVKGGFSCEGCPMDAIISRQLKLVNEVLGLSRDQNV